jgi:hypothetical protein
MVDKDTPPLLGWEVYPSGDGKVEQAVASRLGGAPRRIEYYQVNEKQGVEVVGEAKYQPDYFVTDTQNMQVCIVGASNLKTSDDIEPEPYCICVVSGKPHSEFRTAPRHASFNPSWKHMKEVEDFGRDDELMFSVMSDETLLGQATVNHSKIYPLGFIGDIPLEVPDSEFQDSTGETATPMLSVCITPANMEVPGILCTVSKASGNVGISFVPEKQKNTLSVRAIAEGGQLDKWNHDNPQQQIKIRDRVVSVNGKGGTCKEMLTELAHAKGPLKMMVKRKLSF